MASSPAFSVFSFSSVNTELPVTRLNLVSLNPRRQCRGICDLRGRNCRTSRNVVIASVSFPVQDVSPSSSQRRPDELAASIFSKVMQTDRGVTLTKEEHLQVAELTCELSKYCIDSPVASPLIFGEWDVVYCSNPTSPGGGFRSAFGRLVFKTNEMIQVVETPDVVRNKVSFSALGFLDGQVSLKGKLMVLDEKWIKVVFEPPRLKLGSVEFQFGGESEVQLEITYIDHKLRLGKGSRGSVFVFQRRNINTLGSIGRGRYLATESNKIDEPLKVEEAETVNTPPPPVEKLLVLGGNGFVGSHICKEALDRGLSVASLSRSGKSSIQESWATKVNWHQGDLLSGDSWKEALDGVTSVISCVGGFGSNAHMYKINGTANINAVRAASEKGIKRFVYISAADFGMINYLIQGYYEGKRATETELLTKFPYGREILSPFSISY
ncbi:hypothetical protein R6Q57_006681 [Mikania cordata]